MPAKILAALYQVGKLVEAQKGRRSGWCARDEIARSSKVVGEDINETFAFYRLGLSHHRHMSVIRMLAQLNLRILKDGPGRTHLRDKAGFL
jgi:hypothetical protein